jgi:sec-independent protein translocase protein TatA
MNAQVEPAESTPTEIPDGAFDQFPRAGQGEHRTVVVGIAVNVEQRWPARFRQATKSVCVAPFAHIGDAFQKARAPPGAPLAARHDRSHGGYDRHVGPVVGGGHLLANIFGTDWIWVLLVVVVLFGGSQLPKLAKNAGEAVKEFRKAHDEAADASQSVAAPPAPAQPAAAPPPALSQAPAPTAPAGAQPAPSPEERVTLSRAELDALLADREARAKASAGGSQDQG